MKQFQAEDVVRHSNSRHIERECVIYNLAQCISLDILTKETISNLISDFLEREILDIAEE